MGGGVSEAESGGLGGGSYDRNESGRRRKQASKLSATWIHWPRHTIPVHTYRHKLITLLLHQTDTESISSEAECHLLDVLTPWHQIQEEQRIARYRLFVSADVQSVPVQVSLSLSLSLYYLVNQINEAFGHLLPSLSSLLCHVHNSEAAGGNEILLLSFSLRQCSYKTYEKLKKGESQK